jgi:hypothetical protein
VDAGQVGEPGRDPLDRGLDPAAAQVPELVERARLDRPALANDRDPVGEPLDLAEDVAREQHGRARRDPFGHTVREDLLHQRVQPGGRLVEDQQVDVCRESRDQRHLLPVALGVGAALLGRVEVEPLQQLLPVPRTRVGATHPQQHVHGLTAGEVGPQRHVAGDVGQPTVDRHGVPPRVLAEHGRRTAVDAQQPEQRPDGGRLAGAVRAEEAVHLTRRDMQVEPVEGTVRPERLDEAMYFDHGSISHGLDSTLCSGISETCRLWV